MMPGPTKAESTKVCELLAKYMLLDGAGAIVQQRAYTAWMNYVHKLEKKYGGVFSEEAMGRMEHEARKIAGQKLFRGPGSTY